MTAGGEGVELNHLQLRCHCSTVAYSQIHTHKCKSSIYIYFQIVCLVVSHNKQNCLSSNSGTFAEPIKTLLTNSWNSIVFLIYDCISDIMRCIHLSRTKHDVTEELDAKCLALNWWVLRIFFCLLEYKQKLILKGFDYFVSFIRNKTSNINRIRICMEILPFFKLSFFFFFYF